MPQLRGKWIAVSQQEKLVVAQDTGPVAQPIVHPYSRGWPVQALLGRELSADRQTVTVGTIPARSLVRAVRSDSISNLLGSMWNSQRLTPILRRNVSRVEPAKARDQRSRDRGDRSPLA